jgi:hypothetical protein
LFGSRCCQFAATSPRLLKVWMSLISASDTTLAFWLPSSTLRSWRPDPP